MRFILGVLAGALGAKAYARPDVREKVSLYGSKLKTQLEPILARAGVIKSSIGSSSVGSSTSSSSSAYGASTAAGANDFGFGSAGTSSGFVNASQSTPPYGRH